MLKRFFDWLCYPYGKPKEIVPPSVGSEWVENSCNPFMVEDRMANELIYVLAVREGYVKYSVGHKKIAYARVAGFLSKYIPIEEAKKRLA